MSFKWPLINDNISSKDIDTLVDFLKTPGVRLTQGQKVKEFEEAWSRWLGVKHSVFVNSGASANYIMTAVARDIKGFGEVIVPPLGWVSDIAPVVNLGMTPVFVDVDMRCLSITAENIENAITEETRAIVLVHALGFNGINDKIVQIAKDHNLLLIEDCCESHGATYKNKKIGSFGDMSNFSFYFGHHMTTVEGGMVCTNDDKIYELCKLYRSHGMIRDASDKTRKEYAKNYPDLNPLFTFAVPGFNMRSTEINAVIGLSQIGRLDSAIDKRVKNLSVWLNSLDSKYFHIDFEVEGNSNFSLPLILKEADSDAFSKICRVIEEEGVEYRKGTAGGGNQANQPYLENFSHKIVGNLDNVEHIHHFGLYVGNHTELRDEDISGLAEKINTVF